MKFGNIHSDKFGKMGQSDLGIIGMINFFLNHECNECCKHLPSLNTTLLINHLSTDSILEPQQATTYLFELDDDTMRMDEDSLKHVYAASILETFIEKVVEPKRVGRDERETAQSVAESKSIKQVIVEQVAEEVVVEEEEEESGSDGYEIDEEMEKISHNMNMLWFADETVSGSEYVYGANADLQNVINVDVENQHFVQVEHEQNEWELIN